MIGPKHFDQARDDFAPYGLTCELWEPREMPRADRHNEIELNLLDQGELVYLMGGRRVTMSAGRLTAFWAAVPHQIVEYSSHTQYFVTTVPLAWVLHWELPQHIVRALLHGGSVEERTNERAELDRAMFAQWQKDLDLASAERRQAVLLELKARLLRLSETCQAHETMSAQRDVPHAAEQMATYIAMNYPQQITVADVARSVSMHPDYASALFRKAFGITPHHFITQHRISHAQRMLLTSTSKVLEIALESGYNSLSRFNATFRKLCGCTPRQYRALHGRSGQSDAA
jgi:AraC-like DNA-binding protein